MSYINTDIIKGFLKQNSWITIDEDEGSEVTGVSDLITQIDSIIFNKTGVPVPVSDPTEAPGIIRNVACALFVWYTSGKQGDISADERLRRQKLFDDAMDYLSDVEAGNKQVFDNEGNIVSTQNNDLNAYFDSTQRLTELP